MDEFTGYLHAQYAYSLREFGEPRLLPRCGGWILERPIPGTPFKDAMGCYPLFACRDWSQLHEDVKAIESELVSLSFVTDPFGAFHPGNLARCFEIVKPFKKHFIADLSQELASFVSRHHRYYAQKSLRDLQVDICEEPLRYARSWEILYQNLIRRHHISGIRTFSRASFRTQMQTPGVILLVGKLEGEVIAGHMIVIQNSVAYSHLAAFSDDAYKRGASYGIYWTALQYLQERKIRFLDLGASAGVNENSRDGLARFKAGWSNESRTVYFCGRILQSRKYATICRQGNVGLTDYFPAYRQGEF